MRLGGLALLFFICSNSISQSIEGRILDKVDQKPILGASVLVQGLELGVSSDSLGYFLLDDLEPGRYSIIISHVGYETYSIGDVFVRPNKVSTVHVGLEMKYGFLNEVIIKSATKPFEPGRKNISEEQLNRFAATYYDPARLMLSSPDISLNNDQNNEISIRGIPPNYNIWRLEGAEIVNPNHLSNAGTISDQPTGSAGGVNILSAQTLDRSSIHYGIYDNSLNNSVGGIFDMYFKSGTSSNYQFISQASLIGFDLFAEGPLFEGKKVSFVSNYRYSFTGLLTNMGVDFGGESIGFQDLNLSVNIPFKKGGGIKFFGVGGLNFNEFIHKDFNRSKQEKDRSDIDFDGRMGLIGASYNSGGFKGSVVYSGLRNERLEVVFDDNDEEDNQFLDLRKESIASTNFSYTLREFGGTYSFGVINNYYRYGSKEDGLGQLYFSGEWLLGDRFQINAGLTTSMNDFNDPIYDPRINISIFPSSNISVYVGGGRYSHLLRPHNYYFTSMLDDETYELFDDYRFIGSNRYVVGSNLETGIFQVQVELFFYEFPNVNFLKDSTNQVSAGSAGLSINFSKNFVNGWYLIVGGNLFESIIDDKTNSPFNTKYRVVINWGKEFKKDRKQVDKFFSLNSQIIWQGGAYFTDFEDEPQDLLTLDPFKARFDPYLRFDLRLSWTKINERFTSLIAIDIQNVMNRENDAFIYYDTFLAERRKSTQLGLIPILTYRFEF